MATDPNLIVGTGASDDAGVYRLNDETALIQTVDFFTPVVDDPYRFGQITAANALSDVYAMGGRPLLAMNIVCFPIKEMDPAILRQILEGGINKIEEAGALLVGGHSIDDPEVKYGLAVTGLVHPDRVMLNSGARAGDKLLLTKPVGTGILSTAIKGGLAGEEVEKMITQCMVTLNQAGCEAMTAVGGHGCTDITGFGLIGHLYEMACASSVSIRLFSADVPLLPGVLDFAAMGIIPEGAHKNRQFYEKCVKSCLAEMDPLEMALYDPQTSGGLLISANAKNVVEIAARLNQGDYPLACAVIGEVVEEREDRIVIE